MSEHESSGREPDSEVAESLRHLREAERDLKKAKAEVEEAVRELEQPKVFSIEVLYDGVKKKFEVRPEETVKSLLDRAIAAFGPLPNSHTLSLYKGAEELPDSQTLKQASVKPGDVLLLRPSKVKGGAR